MSHHQKTARVNISTFPVSCCEDLHFSNWKGILWGFYSHWLEERLFCFRSPHWTWDQGFQMSFPLSSQDALYSVTTVWHWTLRSEQCGYLLSMPQRTIRVKELIVQMEDPAKNVKEELSVSWDLLSGSRHLYRQVPPWEAFYQCPRAGYKLFRNSQNLPLL